MKLYNIKKTRLKLSRISFILLIGLTTLLIQECAMIKLTKITVSDLRNPVPQSLVLDNNVKVTTWGAIKVNKSNFFPSSFQVKSKGKVIYIDPVEIDSSEKADYILLTHGHPDHFSIEDIKKIVKPSTIFVSPKAVAEKLSKYNYEIVEIKPGDVFDFGNEIKCEALMAYNTKPVFLWIKAHPKPKHNVGYILTVNDTRIYHAGDTDYVPEIDNIKDIDLALIPISGDKLTMNVEEAAKMINKIKPKKVVPMHYELKRSEDLDTLKNLVEPGIAIVILE